MEKLLRPVHPVWLPLLAILVLALLYGADRAVASRAAAVRAMEPVFKRTSEQMTASAEHHQTLSELKRSDLEAFKTGFANLAVSRKTLFESGLSLQEERRLLDKQLEIMTTYLMINPALQRVFLMRGEQPMQSYLLSYIPLRAFAGAPQSVPTAVRIVSKERFANPERGKSEVVNGKLQWTPPQVGTSIRSNALGEFVMFTNSKLVLHGPPLKPEDHEKFPHICLGLDLEAARRLYRSSFIGTRLVLHTGAVAHLPAIASAPPPEASLAISSQTLTAPATGQP